MTVNMEGFSQHAASDRTAKHYL